MRPIHFPPLPPRGATVSDCVEPIGFGVYERCNNTNFVLISCPRSDSIRLSPSIRGWRLEDSITPARIPELEVLAPLSVCSPVLASQVGPCGFHNPTRLLTCFFPSAHAITCASLDTRWVGTRTAKLYRIEISLLTPCTLGVT